MGIFDWFFRSRDKPSNSYHWSGWPFLFGKSVSGKVVTEITSMQTTAVYACVRLLSESIAGLPLHVYQYKDGGKERAPSHPLFGLLHDSPNPEMTSFTFREVLMVHLLLWGNAYAQIIRDFRGRVIALYPLLPNHMIVNRDDDGNIYYLYTPTAGERTSTNKVAQIRLSQRDVLHIPGLGFDGLVGYSPIAMAKNAIGMTLACEEYGAAFFANGARPGGVLEHPGTVKDFDRLREDWNAAYGGSSNSGKVAILEEGMRYQPIGIPPEEAQFLETRKFQTTEIARLFHVPPHMIGDLERATFSNVEQQSLDYVKYTLNPWVSRWEQSLTKALMTPSERSLYFIKFNMDGLLRGDYASRMSGYSIGIQNGIYSINDVRELEDLNPVPDEEGGNLHLVNGSMTRLADAGLFAAMKLMSGDTNGT